MGNFTNDVVNQTMLYYDDKKFTIGELNLEPTYANPIYRLAIRRINPGVLDGITYKEILSVRNIGEKKARIIALALIEKGVDIPDLPKTKDIEAVRLVVVGPTAVECTNCHAILTTNMDAAQQLYKFCPMCARKFKW